MTTKPRALNVTMVVRQEQRSIVWAQQAINRAHENMLAALNDIPADDPAYAQLRLALSQTLRKLRDTHRVIGSVQNSVSEALVSSTRQAPIPIHNVVLVERYSKAVNGAKQVDRARRDRAEREANYLEADKARKEAERQRFLNGGE
jgi:hypothetical protein